MAHTNVHYYYYYYNVHKLHQEDIENKVAREVGRSLFFNAQSTISLGRYRDHLRKPQTWVIWSILFLWICSLCRASVLSYSYSPIRPISNFKTHFKLQKATLAVAVIYIYIYVSSTHYTHTTHYTLHTTHYTHTHTHTTHTHTLHTTHYTHTHTHTDTRLKGLQTTKLFQPYGHVGPGVTSLASLPPLARHPGGRVVRSWLEFQSLGPNAALATSKAKGREALTTTTDE